MKSAANANADVMKKGADVMKKVTEEEKKIYDWICPIVNKDVDSIHHAVRTFSTHPELD